MYHPSVYYNTNITYIENHGFIRVHFLFFHTSYMTNKAEDTRINYIGSVHDRFIHSVEIRKFGLFYGGYWFNPIIMPIEY